jgi:hypothetical protein
MALKLAAFPGEFWQHNLDYKNTRLPKAETTKTFYIVTCL